MRHIAQQLSADEGGSVGTSGFAESLEYLVEALHVGELRSTPLIFVLQSLHHFADANKQTFLYAVMFYE